VVEHSPWIALKNTLLFGSASAINAGTQILRAKIIALMFGASGIGLLGIYSNFSSMLALLCGLGVGTGAIKQLSAHADEPKVFLSIWKTTTAFSATFALLALAIAFFASGAASRYLTDGASEPRVFVALGLISAVTILVGAFNAYLRSKGLVRQSARLISWATLAGTLLAIGFGRGLPQEWFIVVVLLLPVLAQFALALRDVLKNLGPAIGALRTSPIVASYGATAVKLGGPIILSTLVAASAQLYLRGAIVRELGVEQAGLFQASWAISVGVIGLFLTSIWGDLYPRLAARQSENRALEEIVSDQNRMFVALLSLPLLALTVLPGLALTVLFSAEFTAAVDLLRFQLVGDALKVVSWPLAMLLISQGRAGAFLAAEVVWSVAMLSAFHLLLNRYGLLAANIGYVVAYSCYLVFLALYARKTFSISVRIVIPPTFGLPLAALAGFALARPGLSPIAVALATVISIAMLANFAHWFRGVNQDRESSNMKRKKDDPK